MINQRTREFFFFANIIFLVWIMKPQGAQNYHRLNAENNLLCKLKATSSKRYNGQRSLACVDLEKKVVCLKLPGFNIIHMKLNRL